MLAAGGGGASGGDLLTLNAATVDSYKVEAAATAKILLSFDGGVYYSKSQVSAGAYVWQYNWVEPTANANLYECKWAASPDTPDTVPGTAGTYLALTTSRAWEEVQVPAGVATKTFIIYIRDVGGSSDLKSATITLEAENVV